MYRVYTKYRQQRDRDDDRWVMGIITEMKKEQEKNPMPVEDMLKESQRLNRYGQQQAKTLGIKTTPLAVNRIIHERRKARSS